jgi:hypothetical protein
MEELMSNVEQHHEILAALQKLTVAVDNLGGDLLEGLTKVAEALESSGRASFEQHPDFIHE